MQVSQEVNSFGYIVRFKTGTTDLDVAINTETKMKNKANVILRRKKPRYNVVPVVSNVFDTIKAFSIPLVSDEYIAALETDADILSIEPDIEVSAYAQTVPWGVTRIGTSSSTVADIDGDGSVSATNIFILDTGVAPNHPDLNRFAARSFVPRESSVDDLNGHGTAVAGVAAARDNAEGIVGVCPGAKIHSYKCLDRGGSGQLSWIIAAIEAVSTWKSALPSGSTERAVVNMSLGGYVGSFAYTSLDYAVQSLVAKGVPVVVAAGNSADLAGLYTPAHTTEAITVGAYDSGNNIASFSNYGEVVDILAPGVNILTTGINTRSRKPTYVTYSGTSFSAPHVAGAVALYLTKNPGALPEDISTALKTYGTNANTANTSPLITNKSSFPNTTQVSVYVSEIDV